jgi:HK97 family phage prohead protease
MHYASAVPELSGRMMSFVASTNSVDRYDDVIEQDWDTKDFWANPLLLWSHESHELPIGRVTSFEVSPDRTRSIGQAEFMEPGEYPFADLVHTMVQKKMLNAVSVGFIPTTVERRIENNEWKGYTYKGNKLVEISVVTVPANAEAIAIGRAMGIGPRMMQAFFSTPLPATDGRRARRELEMELELFRVREKRHIDRWTGRVA